MGGGGLVEGPEQQCRGQEPAYTDPGSIPSISYGPPRINEREIPECRPRNEPLSEAGCDLPPKKSRFQKQGQWRKLSFAHPAWPSGPLRAGLGLPGARRHGCSLGQEQSGEPPARPLQAERGHSTQQSGLSAGRQAGVRGSQAPTKGCTDSGSWVGRRPSRPPHTQSGMVAGTPA